MAVSKATLLATLKKARKTADTRYAVTVEKQAVAESGYASTYVLKQNGVQVGEKINVAKDWLLTGVTKGTVTAADKAAGGKFADDNDYAEGDRYIDMAFNVKADGDGGTETTTHLYVNVQEFIDLYTPGNGLQESGGEFSIKIDSTGAGGLTVGANGLKLVNATADTYENGTKTADGVGGAMSSADKYILDQLAATSNETISDEEIAAIFVDD